MQIKFKSQSKLYAKILTPSQSAEVGETPLQRVQFLLGGDGEGRQNDTPPVYSEMEELFYDKEGRLLEWKETAR